MPVCHPFQTQPIGLHWQPCEVPLNGGVRGSWLKHDKGLGQQQERTQGTSVYLSSLGSQSSRTWGRVCQPVSPFSHWLLIPRSDKDTATDPFVLQARVVALKIIWHWGGGPKKKKTGCVEGHMKWKMEEKCSTTAGKPGVKDAQSALSQLCECLRTFLAVSAVSRDENKAQLSFIDL